MAQIIKGIIDTQKSNYRPIGQVNAYDSLELELEIQMNGQAIEFINPECELLIKKSDNNKVRQTKDILYQEGKFKIKVDEQGVTYPGITTCQLLTKENGRVSTCLFYFMVGTSLDREVLQSISKIEILEQLDEYVVTAFANLDEYEKRIIAGDETIRKLNSDISEAEKIRDAAEQKREEFKLLLESKLENGEFMGATGEQGAQGIQGERGPQGEQGPKGETGAQGPKGEQGAQGLPGKDGKNGLDGTNGQDGKDGVTPNIQIGTVTTLEAGEQATVTKIGTDAEPIFDFAIPKGEKGNDGTDGITPDMTEFEKKINEQYDNIEKKVEDHIINHPQSGGTSIDDNTISTEKSWSSAKIEDFVHTNDDVVWSTVQGENLSIDFTKEGYLREVEIWGNTWQDSDGKNLWNPIYSTKEQFGITGVAGNGYYSFDISGLKPNTNYTISIKKIIVPAKGYYRIGIGDSESYFDNLTVKWVISHNNNNSDTQSTLLDKSTTATTGADGILKVWVWNSKGTSTTEWLFDACESIQLEEGNVATDYVDYHKADLSDIRHLGELYVDEEGQPILDELGREQYKIEVKSVNDNLVTLDNISNADKVIMSSLNEFTYNSKVTYWVGAQVTFKIPCKPSTKYTIGAIYDVFEYGGKTNRVTIRDKDNGVEYACSNNSVRSITSGVDSNYLTITYYPIYGEPTPYPTENIITKVKLYLQEGSTCEFLDKTINKTTLLLPCQLMKVGDVADRLFWDDVKKKYVVDKKILNDFTLDGSRDWKLLNSYPDVDNLTLGSYLNMSDTPFTNGTKILASGIKVSNKSYTQYKPSENILYFPMSGVLYLRLLKSELISNDVAGVKDKLAKNNINIYYETTTPQIIETNITEQILLQCYKDKTHLFVTGGIDGGVKAKVPLDGGQAIQSLSAENTMLKTSNIELKQTNEIQDVLINTTMLATDEMYMMLEPLLSEVAQTLSLERSVSKMVDMYVAMVMRGLKTIEQVPARYREEVREILAQLEK